MLKLYLSNFIFWPDLGHHTISGGASSAIKGLQRWICPIRFENKSKKISCDMNFATTSPMGFGAPTLHKQANKSTARLYHAPSLFAVKSTFAHKYFRTKWKPGTARSALNGRKYKHFPPIAVFTLILCKPPSLPSIPWFYFPAGCPLLPNMPLAYLAANIDAESVSVRSPSLHIQKQATSVVSGGSVEGPWGSRYTARLPPAPLSAPHLPHGSSSLPIHWKHILAAHAVVLSSSTGQND